MKILKYVFKHKIPRILFSSLIILLVLPILFGLWEGLHGFITWYFQSLGGLAAPYIAIVGTLTASLAAVVHAINSHYENERQRYFEKQIADVTLLVLYLNNIERMISGIENTKPMILINIEGWATTLAQIQQLVRDTDYEIIQDIFQNVEFYNHYVKNNEDCDARTCLYDIKFENRMVSLDVLSNAIKQLCSKNK